MCRECIWGLGKDFMSEHDDRTMAARLRVVDAGAWHTFHDAFVGRLWRSVARRVGPAADVVQESLLAAARNARQYDLERESLWNWLWGIGHRQVALYYRRRGRMKASEEDAEAVLVWLDGAVVDAWDLLSLTIPAAIRSNLARVRIAFREALLHLVPCATEEHHDIAGH